MLITLRKPFKLISQFFLTWMGKYNYHLIKGNLNPSNRCDYKIFMEGVWSVSMDWVRNTTLELLCREIIRHGVKGNTAEIGVYQGDFSALINHHLPDRSIYLFDTFTGFDNRDTVADRNRGIEGYQHDFSITSTELVLKKMPYPERVIFRPGRFPETATGLEEENFCLVSLDTDLYEPIYEGLKWFYPRLSQGGYIMIHDYFNDNYAGAGQAVRKYVAENGLSFTVIPDTGGTAIIGKPYKAGLTPR